MRGSEQHSFMLDGYRVSSKPSVFKNNKVFLNYQHLNIIDQSDDDNYTEYRSNRSHAEIFINTIASLADHAKYC